VSAERDLVRSWLGVDFELRPGETLPLGNQEAAVRAGRFRDVLSRFATGVAVVTGLVGDHPVGMTCQSFTSVSLEPPLVLFCPARTARAWPRMRRAGTFCVNVLAADQGALSDRMATRGADKFAGVRWTPAPVTGSPLLGGVVAWVDCSVHAVHRAGDHDVVLGRVLDLGHGVDGPGEPLTYHRGRYGTTRE
jgi:3-hydroxy-9,10-secoandrosta-1,3,5(10)-triene-9,17-dione monooxygenase reductase component